MPKPLLCVRLHALLLVACCCLFRTSSAQFTRPDFTGRKHVSIAAVDDFLYIHGGEPSNKDDNKYYDTLVIHLKDKWPANSPTIAPMNWATTAVQMLGHRVWGFQLWKMSGTKSLLSWGGFRTTNATMRKSDDYPGDAPLSRDLFVLATDGRGIANWSPEKPAADPGDSTLTQAAKANNWGPGMGYSVSCAGYGIYLGGVAAQPTAVNGTPPPFGGTWSAGSQLRGGLVTYEIATKKWSNATVPPDVFPSAGVMGGSAVCVPHLGERGLVLFLGGYADRPGSDLAAAAKGGVVGSSLSLGRLVFYDPVKKQWLSQAATGDVPPERRHFCAVGVRSTPHGRNSTEVYVFGGDVAGSSPGPAGDLYVLSLPAMNWWRVLHGQPELSGHACEVVGKRQMVVLGGQGRNGTAAAARDNMGIRIFDMGTQDFVQDYSPTGDPYESPNYIKTWYSEGNLEHVSWNNDRVKAAMLQIPDNSTNSDPAKDATKEPGKNTVAIVGGAVGGAVALLVAGIAAWLLARRRRRNRYKAVDAAAAVAAAPPATGDDGPAPFPYKPELDSSPAAARSELASTHVQSPELHSVAVSSATTASWPPKSPAPWTAAPEADSWVVHEMLAQVPGGELQDTQARAELLGS